MTHSLAVFSLLLAACGGAPAPAPSAPAGATTPAPTAGSVREVDVTWLHDHLAEVPVLVDVRTPGEYTSGHVAGTLPLPLSALAARMGELSSHRGEDVYVICQSGGRSASAARALAAAGYHAVNVAGGTGAWIAAGYPVE